MKRSQKNVNDIVANLKDKLRAYKSNLKKIDPGLPSKIQLFEPAKLKEKQLLKIKQIEMALELFEFTGSIESMDKMVDEVKKLFAEVKKHANYCKAHASDREVNSWAMNADEKFVNHLLGALKTSGLADAKKVLQKAYSVRDLTYKLTHYLNQVKCTVHRSTRDKLVQNIQSIYGEPGADEKKLEIVAIELINQYRSIRSDSWFGKRSKLADAIKAVLIDGVISSDLASTANRVAEDYVKAIKTIIENKAFRDAQNNPQGMMRIEKILASNEPPVEKFAKICAEGKHSGAAKPGLFSKKPARTSATQEFYEKVASGDISNINDFKTTYKM